MATNSSLAAGLLAAAQSAQSPVAIPTSNPGELYIPALDKTIQQIEWREDDIYDTVAQPSGLITAGTELDLFLNLQGKQLQFSSLKKASSIPANNQVVVSRVGVHINQALGAVLPTDGDIIAIAHAGVLQFAVNGRLITQGPLLKYQSGYGMTGSTTRNATGIVTTGVPSAAAAPSLYVAQPVTDNDDITGSVTFPSLGWLATNADGAIVGTTLPSPTTAIAMTCYLHGIIRKPQGA
jgi:hypothetical protein